MGNYAGAVTDLKRTAELKDKYYGYHYSLAAALAKLGNYSQALERADRALALKADYAPACALKGDIFSLMKDKDAAREQYRKAAQYAPESAAMYLQRAAALDAAPRKAARKK